MSIFSERLQVLVSPEQRRRLEAEAKRQGSSVAVLVRAAIDDRYGHVTSEDRLQAVGEIAAMRGRYLTPGEIEAVLAEEREPSPPGR